MENIPVQLTLLIHIPERRQATNMRTKKHVQKNTDLVTKDSEIRT